MIWVVSPPVMLRAVITVAMIVEVMKMEVVLTIGKILRVLLSILRLAL
jgi:hypothetical protein